MSTDTPTLSVATNFGNSLDPKDLPDFITHVNNDGGITSGTLNSIIDYTGDVVTCKFSAAITTGEQTTLANLATTFVPKVIVGTAIPNFDALVATDGSGDYTKPSAAFAAGAKTVYVRAGTYVEFVDIVLPNNGVMIGESTAPVILYFVGNVGVKIDGSGGVKETIGTISITNSTNAVTGVGTTFTNLAANQYILLEQNFYQIASITDDTNLTLTETYNGKSLTGEAYIGQNMHTAVTISNMIITNSSGTGLYIRAARSSTIASIGAMINYQGIDIIDSSTNAMSAVNCYANTNYGMYFHETYSIGLINGESYNNGSNGYHVDGNSNNIVFNGVLANNNNGNGINITGNSTKILINDCTVKRNNGIGIHTDTNTGAAVIDGSIISNNGNIGVSFNGANDIISNCIISENTGSGITAGDNGTVTGNHIFENGSLGVDLTGDDNCQIATNNIHNNTGDGIYTDGINNGISDNSIRNNGGMGININGGDDIDIDGNTIADNTGEGIKLTGTCNMIIVANNRIKNNTIGIEIPATSNDCVINGNIISGNTNHGISVASNECIIIGNRCKSNGGDGCIIVTGGTNNTVKINRFTGNTGSDFTNNGTTTITDL